MKWLRSQRHRRPPAREFVPPAARFDHHHKRHASLVSTLYYRGLRLAELTELIDLRIAMGAARCP